MTEEEWLERSEPARMLEFLRAGASDRKLRLFACACCRRIAQLMDDEVCRTAVLTAERYADGLAPREELTALSATLRVTMESESSQARSTPPQLDAQITAWFVTRYPMADPGYYPSYRFCQLAADASRRTYRRGKPKPKDYAVQAELLRCVFGNPFRPVSLNPAWLAWNEGTVSRLAQAIYDDRAFDRLPILADALEEAGCDNAEILSHCRGPGRHVRGCWPVDFILGKG